MVGTESRRFYPTPSTTKFFVRGVEIDDIFRVDFQRTVNHQPVYGYNSSQFGFVARGKELVTGQIIINYRYPGYLMNVVWQQIEDRKAVDEKLRKHFDKTAPVSAGIEDTVADVDMQSSTSDRTTIIANRLSEAYKAEGALTNSDIVKKLKEAFQRKYFFAEAEDRVFHLESPLDRNRLFLFDMTIQYGFFQADFPPYTRIFRDCVLTGESETVSASAGAGNDMSSSAQPILEIYPFFARTIETKKGQGSN